ncbi:hypothetical protein D3C71_1251630 [compost metagenome]
MGGAAEDVQHVTHAVAHRVHQVEALLGDVRLVADDVERVDHEIHRHDIHAPAFQAHGGQPGRQQLAQPLNELEEVIRPVDLVHLPRCAVAHHHGGAVYRPWHLAVVAHDFFALVFGLKVRMVQPFGLCKHVFAEHALIQACGSDRRDVVEMPGVDGLGQLDRVARAFDVHGHLGLFVSTQVVHRCQVVEMIDLALEFFDVFARNAQLLGRQIAEHRDGAGRPHTPEATQIGHLVGALLADQEVHHAAFALQQLLDQPLANEPRCPRHEILHGKLL